MDDKYYKTLARYAKVNAAKPDDILFDGGLDLSSIRFTEFIMELEEIFDIEVDVDGLDETIKTAGQLKAAIIPD